MGRRATKKVTTNGSVTLHQRYVYRGYLQIACCDLTRSQHPALWFITWDPSQPVATRPLAIQKDGTWYTYGWDLTKNICEVYGQHGYIRTNYSYSPYGEVTISGDVTQPIQWSSEYYDIETALVYYNYRYYSPCEGRWISRDRIQALGGSNLYAYLKNHTNQNDYLGAIVLASLITGALVGVAVGFISRAVGDMLEGKRSSGAKYAGAIIGGAVGGIVKNPLYGAAAASFTEEAISRLFGENDGGFCKFTADVVAGTALTLSGQKFIKMPHLEQPIKNWIKKEMASETGWFFINLKRDIEKGIKDGIRVDRLYTFSKEVYRKLPGGVSTPIRALPTAVTRLMNNNNAQIETNYQQPETIGLYYAEINYWHNIYVQADDYIYVEQFQMQQIIVVPVIDDNILNPPYSEVPAYYLD